MSIGFPVGQIDQLERSDLWQQARRVIRSSIITGVLKPGQIHTAGSIAQQLGVSVTPVREALQDLAREGMVDIIRSRGFRVPPVTEQDLDEIFELRMMLEVQSIEKLATQFPSEKLKHFRQLTGQIMVFAEASDLTGFLDFDHRFHLGLLRQLGNRRLVEIVGRLRDQARLPGLPELAQTGQLMASAAEHEQILHALQQGDASQARSSMIRHLQHSRGIWAGQREQRG